MNKLSQSMLIVFLFFMMIIPLKGFAQQSNMQVTEFEFCQTINDRQPVGVDTVFADTVGTVYCYTQIAGVSDTAMVFHVWYHDNEKRANVKLQIAGDPWRTWSSKRILKSWTGNWRVDVVNEDGNVIRTKQFVVESTE